MPSNTSLNRISCNINHTVLEAVTLSFHSIVELNLITHMDVRGERWFNRTSTVGET